MPAGRPCSAGSRAVVVEGAADVDWTGDWTDREDVSEAVEETEGEVGLGDGEAAPVRQPPHRLLHAAQDEVSLLSFSGTQAGSWGLEGQRGRRRREGRC